MLGFFIFKFLGADKASPDVMSKVRSRDAKREIECVTLIIKSLRLLRSLVQRHFKPKLNNLTSASLQWLL